MQICSKPLMWPGICLGGALLRPESPRAEIWDWRLKAGEGVLRMGQWASSHLLWSLESAVNSPSGVWDGALTAKHFWYYMPRDCKCYLVLAQHIATTPDIVLSHVPG